MEAWHQKNLLDADFPFNLLITDIIEFPPHWHEEIEVIYVLDETLKIGLNNEVYILEPRDIFLVGVGDVHYFLSQPKKSKRVIIQFELSIFEAFSTIMRDRRFTTPLIMSSERQDSESDVQTHRELEKQILSTVEEYKKKEEGYRLALKARLYDLVVILLRQVPMERYSPQQKNKHLNRLERLEQVFQYVENNFHKNISLEEIANTANFSIYHFTRFFKETTGMTFIEYLNNFRITKATGYLTNGTDSITEVSFKSGFSSIKTFNRVFKQLKGRSPTCYKKAIYE